MFSIEKIFEDKEFYLEIDLVNKKLRNDIIIKEYSLFFGNLVKEH